MGVIQTEFAFSLPMGYVDNEGTLHKNGTIRLATAGDEILPMKDPRVQQNQAYWTIILLSRVITKLGSIEAITPQIIEGLFAADLAYLHDMYNRINHTGSNHISATCPKCGHTFDTEMQMSGE